MIRLTKMQRSRMLTDTGGDVKFPHWDWDTMSMKPKPSKHRFHNSFHDIILDHGLEQHVMEPTRLEYGSLPDEQLTSKPQS